MILRVRWGFLAKLNDFIKFNFNDFDLLRHLVLQLVIEAPLIQSFKTVSELHLDQCTCAFGDHCVPQVIKTPHERIYKQGSQLLNYGS